MAGISHRLTRALSLLRDDLKTCGIGLAFGILALPIIELVFGVICPVRLLLGLPCPGCGLTRGALLWLSGEPLLGHAMHPMALPAMILILAFPITRYFLPKGFFRAWKVLALLWAVTTLVIFPIRMLTLFPNVEPLCFYEEGRFVDEVREFLERIGFC